jgi:hypothetical protein
MSLNIQETSRTAIISTAHVTQPDSVRLHQISFEPLTDRGLNWVHSTGFGWIIRAGEVRGDWKAKLSEFGISAPTIKNIEKVIKAGFDAVHFDRNADVIDGLQSWEW